MKFESKNAALLDTHSLFAWDAGTKQLIGCKWVIETVDCEDCVGLSMTLSSPEAWHVVLAEDEPAETIVLRSRRFPALFPYFYRPAHRHLEIYLCDILDYRSCRIAENC